MELADADAVLGQFLCEDLFTQFNASGSFTFWITRRILDKARPMAMSSQSLLGC